MFFGPKNITKMSSCKDCNKRVRDKQSSERNRANHEEKNDTKIWGVILFGLIGVTATTAAVTQLRRPVNRAILQEHIRRMQTVFNRERSKYKRSYESWSEYAQNAYNQHLKRSYRSWSKYAQNAYNQHFQRSYGSWSEYAQNAYNQHFKRNGWYWNSNPSFKNRGANNGGANNRGASNGGAKNGGASKGGANNGGAKNRKPPQATASYPLSHHYSVLGLDRTRTTPPYTDAEIKTAFRMMAKQVHPDQNQENKDAAEAKFKQVMMSYEAIQLERKNNSQKKV